MRAAGLLVSMSLVSLVILFWRDVLPEANLAALVSGTAHRPFVYRRLVPLLIWLLAPSPSWYAPVGLVIVFAFVIGYVFLLRTWTTSIIPATLSALLMFLNGGFVYDAATLYFSLLVLILIERRKFVWLIVVFPLACLNRETAILFVVPLVLYHGLSSVKIFLLMAIEWIIIRTSLVWMFQANHGGAIEWQIDRRLTLFIKDPCGFLVLWSVPILFLVAAYGGWQKHDRFLRACWPLPLILYMSFVLFGCPGEWRVFAEVHTVLFLMIEQSRRPLRS